MNHFWRNLASFTKRERRGAFIFTTLLIVILFAGKFVPGFIEQSPWYVIEDSAKVKSWIDNLKQQQKLNLSKFNPNKVAIEDLYNMGIPSSVASGWIKYLDAGGHFYNKSDLRKLYGMPDTLYAKLEPWLRIPQKRARYYNYQEAQSGLEKKTKPLKNFNPNTYSEDMLIDAGVKAGIAKNIISYRNAGGNFYVKTDLMKLYAVDDAYFNQLKPYINIDAEASQIIKVDSVELNSTTIDELLQLNIKKNVARRIINYRELLGGFYSHKQLDEVYHIDPYTITKLNESSWIDTLLIKTIDINKVDEYNLAQHPYITRKVAEQIRKYRDFASEIESLDELFNLGIMEPQSREKLKYYLLF